MESDESKVLHGFTGRAQAERLVMAKSAQTLSYVSSFDVALFLMRQSLKPSFSNSEALR